jgi:predicted transcriptional regulator
MSKETVSVRLEVERRAELDAPGKVLDRDRSWLINRAIDAYLELQRWQIEQIEEGVRQAEAGDFASDEEVSRVLRRG